MDPPDTSGSSFGLNQRLESSENCYTTDAWFAQLQESTHALVASFRRYPIKRRIKVAILDTGIDVRHAAFEDTTVKQEDFLDPQGDAFDEHGHGTYCAGLLCKVAPEAEIYVARVLNGGEAPNPEAVIKALNRASLEGTDEDGVQNWDVDVITLSFGFYAWNQDVYTALQYVDLRGKIVFAAAANDRTRHHVAFPASLPQVISVFSANGDGSPSSFNPPPMDGVGFCVIGENVESAWRCGDRGEVTAEQKKVTRRQTGTDVATPIAAGILALLLELIYQGPKADRQEGGMFDREVFQRLETYNGVACALRCMEPRHSRSYRSDYTNIVPWKLLSNLWGRNAVAGALQIALLSGER
ncbi:hypothetical protein QQX98_000434 [Neonectria punicea]|uniref:Peptidase S8/S53 domain-containing protein n=1 Tax=Neonectria punicea TaxID=979145 RepID=A0ABR1HU16_9HYPO